MKIEKQPLDNHQIKLTVEVESKQLEASKRRAARKLSRQAKIPGFRPGKAPYEVVVRHFGEEAVLEEALDMLVDEIYPKVLDEAEIKPGAPGILESVESVDPPRFTFTVPLEPEVDLGDYRAVRVPYDYRAPGDEEVEKSLEDLRRMYATTKTVERPIQEGDFVLLSIQVEKAKTKEGEEALIAENDNFAVYVAPEEKEKEDEWPFKGFARQLIGLKPEEEKTLSYTYPKDHSAEELRGQKVRIAIKVKAVRGVETPPLDDEFARMIGAENLDDLRQRVRTNLENEARARYDDEYTSIALEKIKAGATIKYPPQLVEHEMEHMMEDIRERLAAQNMELETYLKMREMDEKTFLEEEVKPAAIQRLEEGLLLETLARAENIQVTPAELEQAVQQTLNALQEDPNVDLQSIARGGRKARQEFSNAIITQTASQLLLHHTLKRVRQIASGEVDEEQTKAGTGEEEASEEKKPAPKKSKKKAASPKSAKGKSSQKKTTSGKEQEKA